MPPVRWTVIVAAGFAGLWSSTTFADDQMADPLFADDSLLELRFELPLTTLKANRDSEDELTAKVAYTSANGDIVEVDVEVRARGRYRRRADVCVIPPIRLNFKTSAVEQTVFANQDKLKLVTHCRGTMSHDDAIAREHLTYQLLNGLTDNSYRVRGFSITYVDTDGEMETETRFGFVIENKHRFAARTGQPLREIPRTHVHELQADYSNMISLFHFMIGNTDYSQILGAEGEPCCHNHELYAKDDSKIYSVPYDFDQAGIVDAPHALPNPRFRLRDVQQRLYRGRCVNNELLPGSITLFTEKRTSFDELIEAHPALKPRGQKKVRSYLNAFYKVISSEKKVQRSLIKKCI